MILNSIENGSAIPVTPEIDEIAEEFFGIVKPEKILIVEGESDRNVLENYFYIEKISIDFSIRTAQMADGGSNSGKKVAIDYYEKNKLKQNIRLLIDRDYDFLCSEKIEDINIFYYDYYELENYFLDEKVLKSALVSNNVSTREIESIINFLNSDEVAILPPLFDCSKLRIFRELHKTNKTKLKLDSNKIKLYSEFVKSVDIKGCILGKNPELIGETFEERITYYLASQLDEIDSGLYEKIKNQVDLFGISVPHSIGDFMKYYYKGKDIITIISDLFMYTGILSRGLSDLNSKKLLNTFIFQSNLFQEKIKMICQSFD